MTPSQVLDYLARTDKWYLGGGKGLIWAPEFPVFLDKPGFWDQAYYIDHAVSPVFTLSLLNEELEEICLQFEGRRWRPDVLVQQYKTGEGLEVAEKKCLTPFDALTTTYEVTNRSERPRNLKLVLWTCQPAGEFKGNPFYNTVNISDPTLAEEGFIVFNHFDSNPKNMKLEKAVAFGAGIMPDSYCAVASQNTGNLPQWNLTPFYEKMQSGKLPCKISLSGVAMELLGIPDQSLVYMGLHFEFPLEPGETRALRAGLCVAPGRDSAVSGLVESVRAPEPPYEISRRDWEAFFSQVPDFECSDPYMQKYYWYRWFGIKLNLINIRQFNLKHPCIAEGPNPYYFRRNISYSAQCHMLECRWLDSPEIAQGSILNFCENQRRDGLLPASIGATENLDYLIYHANWGMAIEELDRVHPDTAFLERVYGHLARYLEFLDRDRDPEGTGLYTVTNQFETGQEYMSRYLFADENADAYSWYDPNKDIGLKGLDATVYAYELKRVLAKIARKLGRSDDAARLEESASKTKSAVATRMWDPDVRFFVDTDRAGENRSWAKAAVGFYPFMTDIASEDHLAAFYEHLFNPAEFWTPYPVPATSADDPFYDEEAEWKGKRHICPWNGRVWPMTSSHVCEALARASLRFDSGLKAKAAELISRFIRMMFVNQDVDRPNCFEHYSPVTGKASFYRGVDDYQHSWVVDLIIKYVVGFRPTDEAKVVVDPLPFGLSNYSISRVPFRGHKISVSWDKDRGMRLWVDGAVVAERHDLGRLECDLEAVSGLVSRAGGGRLAVNGEQLAASGEWPAANGERPAANGDRWATNGGRPEVGGEHSTASVGWPAARGDQGAASGGTGRLAKKCIIKDDGRYLIFYGFERQGHGRPDGGVFDLV